MLAIQVGVREAARRMDISEEAVKRRCTREGWIVNLPRNVALPPTVIRHVPNVPNGGDLMVKELVELGKSSRVNLARGLAKGAAVIEQMTGEEVIEKADSVKQTAQSLALVHSWQSAPPSVNVHLRLGATAQADCPAPPTIDVDCEVMEEPASLDVNDY